MMGLERGFKWLDSLIARGTPKGAGGVTFSVSPRVPAVGAMSATGGAKFEPPSRPPLKPGMAVFKPKTDGGARISFLGAKGSASAFRPSQLGLRRGPAGSFLRQPRCLLSARELG